MKTQVVGNQKPSARKLSLTFYAICMKCQTLLSRKNEKQIILLWSADFSQSAKG